LNASIAAKNAEIATLGDSNAVLDVQLTNTRNAAILELNALSDCFF